MRDSIIANVLYLAAPMFLYAALKSTGIGIFLSATVALIVFALVVAFTAKSRGAKKSADDSGAKN